MKPITAISLLALAYATAVSAIPMPEVSAVSAVSAKEADTNTLNARDPMPWGDPKYFPGETEGYKKRDFGEPDGQGEGHGFDHSQDYTGPNGASGGMPGYQGPPQGTQGQGQRPPSGQVMGTGGGYRGQGQGQGMGGGNQAQGMNGGWGGQGKAQ